MKHTPAPYHLDPDEYEEYIWGPNGEMVAQLRGHGAGLPKRANGEFIVRAVNSYAALLTALKYVRQCMNERPEEPHIDFKVVEYAIKKAEESD